MSITTNILKIAIRSAIAILQTALEQVDSPPEDPRTPYVPIYPDPPAKPWSPYKEPNIVLYGCGAPHPQGPSFTTVTWYDGPEENDDEDR